MLYEQSEMMSAFQLTRIDRWKLPYYTSTSNDDSLSRVKNQYPVGFTSNLDER
jgi:hypothetical protein